MYGGPAALVPVNVTCLAIINILIRLGVEVKLGTRVGEVFGMFGVQRSKSTDNI